VPLSQIAVIVPARDEEESIGLVLRDIPTNYRLLVIVVDNGSRDRTAEVARQYGAVVLQQPLRGYGNVMLKGLAYLATQPVDIVVFLDGDYSDYPEEMPRLVEPIQRGESDMVLSTRLNPMFDKAALPPHVVYGNRFCVFLTNLLFGTRYTDLGPFRAIRYDALMRLRMEDRNYGWTVEMQIKAKLHGLRTMEIPMRYRKRVGQSKISGTIRGSVLAGSKIIYTIIRLFFVGRRIQAQAR
jgi:glycosyltransferase involved in cell wall biosynthesis